MDDRNSYYQSLNHKMYLNFMHDDKSNIVSLGGAFSLRTTVL